MNIEDHNLGDLYSIRHRDGSVDSGWKLAYSNLLRGTFHRGQWKDYTEPYVLIEKPLHTGIDIREVPARFLTKQTSVTVLVKTMSDIIVKDHNPNPPITAGG